MADFDTEGFLRFSDRLQTHKIVQEDKLGKTFVGLGINSPHDPTIRATLIQEFSIEEFESLLLRVRIFLNRGDRVYFEDAYNYAKSKTPSPDLAEQMDAAYSNFKYRVTMGIFKIPDGKAIDPNGGPTAEKLVDLMLNAELFHNDANKQEKIRIRKEIAGELSDVETRAFYMSVRDFIKLIAEIRIVIAGCK